ncbi:glycosyltransferase involved in cell wall biosynthesis [Natrinema hispanicum]|uniref:Glycosyltransferase involved in cell wall biosynthesis n=1 Tax=Natrinema hispanicum TaxID=392421 RepID=A0A482YB02_9EURY|nr:glycosyltransferase involved in cell wall biosynthesis [Natrinema hispanicum]
MQLRTGIESLSTGLSPEADVTVLTPSDGEHRITEAANVTYQYYNAAYVPGVRYTLPTPSFLRQLSNLIDRSDLVHVYSYFYPVCATAVIEAARRNTPSVVTVDSLPGVNWTSGSRLVDLIGRSYTATLGRATFKAATRTVALGNYLLDPLTPYVSADKQSVIPNGIDTEKFSPAPNDSRDKTETTELLFIGRLDPVKGIPTLLKSMKRLSRGTDDKYHLTIVGDGTKRDEYERQCIELGIDTLVTFEGYQADVVPYYRSHDLFVLPSLSEGQPTVLLEAQSCGLPVISTDVGAASELIEVGETVPPNDDRSLARTIDSFFRTGSDVRQRARSNIVERYSKNAMCESYWKLYRRLWNDD